MFHSHNRISRLEIRVGSLFFLFDYGRVLKQYKTHHEDEKQIIYNIRNFCKDCRLQATIPSNLLSMLPMLIANNRNCFLPTLQCRNNVKSYRPKEKIYLAVGAK